MTGLLETEPAVETMRILSNVPTRELDPITTVPTGQFLGRLDHARTNPLTATIGAHVNALQLAAPLAGVLEMTKDNDLHDADHFAVVGDQNVTETSTGLFHRGPIGLHVFDELNLWRQGALTKQPGGEDDIISGDRTNHQHRTSPGDRLE